MSVYRHFLVAGVSIMALGLTGCMEGAETGSDPAGEATAFSERPANSRIVERDVEAPEVFQVADSGLWDGRPSLGGVWVAYPDVGEPERVIIRNDSNDKFVIGALFKREREHPGPKFQVSSDAAAALGMLAGAPVTLDVTALRREEPQSAPVPAEADVAEANEAPETDPAAADATDAPAQEIAAETEATERNWNPFRRKPKQDAGEVAAEVAVASTTVGVTAEDGVSVEPAASVASSEPAPRKQGWNPFRRKPKQETNLAAADGAITTEALSHTRPVAAEAAAAPSARQMAAASKLDKPYLQIGIFSVEENARNTATALRQNGVAPEVYQQESSGKTFWRVIAGPSASKVDRAVMLRKVKSMGFADAYPVGG